MGASVSKSQVNTDNKDYRKTLDYIASNYILTQNFIDMKRLSDIKYCNNLVVLTAKIIETNLNDKEISYLSKRIKNGKEVEEMTKERVIYLDKDLIDDLDIKNKEQKTNMCYGIAKFYIMIAHIFAAIITTINPTWKYLNDKGEEEKVGLEKKSELPSGGAVTEVNGICVERMDALLNDRDVNGIKDSTRVIKPRVCTLNIDGKGKTKMLINEPGIPELAKLYEDNWDPKEGRFIGMTDKTRKEVYEKDVERFYKAFTGNSKIPVGEDNKPLITTFSQIPLRDFHNGKECASEDGKFRKEYRSSLKNKLFVEYANNLKAMMQSTTENQNKLLKIIDKLFFQSINPLTNKTEIVINPLLKMDDLPGITAETRNLIINLYITCENEFMRGFKIFEAIIEKQMFDTDIKQIENLQENVQESYVKPPPDGIPNNNEDAFTPGEVEQARRRQEEQDRISGENERDINRERQSNEERERVEDRENRREQRREDQNEFQRNVDDRAQREDRERLDRRDDYDDEYRRYNNRDDLRNMRRAFRRYEEEDRDSGRYDVDEPERDRVERYRNRWEREEERRERAYMYSSENVTYEPRELRRGDVYPLGN